MLSYCFAIDQSKDFSTQTQEFSFPPAGTLINALTRKHRTRKPETSLLPSSELDKIVQFKKHNKNIIIQKAAVFLILGHCQI